MIDKKFIIKRKSDGKYLQIVYGDSQELVFVDSFLNAMMFEDRERVKKFGLDNGLTLQEYSLFQLNVSANPVQLNP